MLFNVQTAYSLLQSTLMIEDYVISAKNRGYKSIGISDVNVLYGVYEFYQLCIKNNIKPMIGMTVELTGCYNTEKQYKFLLYAKSEKGYLQLIKISRFLNQSNQSFENLINYLSEFENLDLVYITVGRYSELEQLIYNNESEKANQYYFAIKKLFNRDIYMGIAAYPYNNLEINYSKKFAEQNNIPLIMVQNINTLDANDVAGLIIMKAIYNNEIIDRTILQANGSHYLYPQTELFNLYQKDGLEEIINNTEILVNSLNVTLPKKTSLLPKFRTPTLESSDDYLYKITSNELNSKYINHPKYTIYIERLNHELTVIKSMGFSDYFLIVADIMDFCHKNNIQTGPGRGSAAGSLVSYLLKITSIDPIEYNLLFERFLNPERYNMPDIDIDIPDNKRNQVLKYIQNKYGFDNVAQIITFGTFGAKQSIRDTLRVLGYDQKIQKDWSSAIPTDQNQQMTLQRALKESSELQMIINTSEENQKLYSYALMIEGLPRHTSTHAAAIVINDFPLEEIIPVIDKSDSSLQTQFTMYDIESIGLLKMDFLGLRNLSLLNSMITNIKKHYDEKFDIDKIPFDDVQTIQIFKKADTNGVFQFESNGIKNVLKQLKPENFEEIIAVIALYRPGPMKQIPHYIKRRNGEEKIDYINPILKPILESTYGVIVYQEQVMQMVRAVANFTYGEADILRRAMSKKNITLMKKYEPAFMEGAKTNGFSHDDAVVLFNYIEEFSNYGFNRAHSVVYSALAFQLAYIKAHYPQVFYTEILNSGQSQTTTFIQYINEAKIKLGRLNGLDINKSYTDFSFINNKISVGFSSVKGLKKDFIKEIINDRNQLGSYTDFINFLQRIPEKFLDSENIKPLIYGGAFDSLGYSRSTLINNLDKLIQSVKFSGNNISLFKDMEPKIIEFKEFSNQEKSNFENEIYGFSLDVSTFYLIQKKLSQIIVLQSIEEISQLNKLQHINILGIVKNIKEITTKNGNLMAFVTLTDEINEITLVCFNDIYNKYNKILFKNNIILVKGKVDINNRNERQIIPYQLQVLTEDSMKEIDSYDVCFIRIKNFTEDKMKIDQLKNIISNNRGVIKVIIVDNDNKAIELNNNYLIKYNSEVYNDIKRIFGKENVIFK